MEPLSFGARLGLALRLITDGAFASRAFAVKDSMPALPAPVEAEPTPQVDADEERERGALLLLQALQQQGRLVDFLEQEVASFPDADIGAAARLVHEGARKALREHVPVSAIRAEDEGAAVSGVTPGAHVKLVGEVGGKGPFKGTLRHKGWRAGAVKLPQPTAEHDAHVIAPAEVEL